MLPDPIMQGGVANAESMVTSYRFRLLVELFHRLVDKLHICLVALSVAGMDKLLFASMM